MNVDNKYHTKRFYQARTKRNKMLTEVKILTMGHCGGGKEDIRLMY